MKGNCKRTVGDSGTKSLSEPPNSSEISKERTNPTVRETAGNRTLTDHGRQTAGEGETPTMTRRRNRVKYYGVCMGQSLCFVLLRGSKNRRDASDVKLEKLLCRILVLDRKFLQKVQNKLNLLKCEK